MSSITVAIPFYNAEKYLSQAIESVIGQTHKDWTLLLVNDGSTDKSLKIANYYEKLDSRIIVYSDGENKNLGYRLNEIPNLCKTKFLARMDADDIMHPQRIEKQLKVLKENDDIDVLGTNAYTIDENNDVVGLRNRFQSHEELVEVKGFIHPTIMAKTEWFKNNPYDVNAERIEDLELWYRTNKKCTFRILAIPYFFYREFEGGYYKKYEATQKAKKYILKKYPNDEFWIKYFKDNLKKARVYKFFNFFNLEGYLIIKRNQVIFKDKIKISTLISDKY